MNWAAIGCAVLLLASFCPRRGWAQVDQENPERRPVTSSNTDRPMQRLDVHQFYGTIRKGGNGQLVLLSNSTMIAYQLDNQKAVQPYVGEEVRLDGSLINHGRAIHITGVEVAPQ